MDETFPGSDFTIRQMRALMPTGADAAAWFDPASGIVAHSVSRELAADASTDAARIQLTPGAPFLDIDHEWAHFIQAIGLPFVRRWSTVWGELVGSLVYVLRNEIIAGNGYAAVKLAALQPGVAEPVRDALGYLALRNSWGITTLDLMEAHAMRVEAGVHIKDEDFGSLWSYLGDHAPNDRYRRSYDIVRLFCGDRAAHAQFHAIASLSLSFTDPPRAFQAIVQEIARTFPVTTQTVEAAAVMVSADVSELVGWPFTFESEYRHAFLQTQYARAKDWVEESGLSADDLLEDVTSLVKCPVRPAVVYGTREDETFETIPGDDLLTIIDSLSDDELRASMTYQFTIAAVSQYLIKTHLTALLHEGDSAALTGNSWLATMPTNIPVLAVDIPTIVAARAAGEDVEPLLDQQARNIVKFLCWNPATGASEPMPRNRVILSFDGDFEGEVWEDGLAQRLCRRLAEHCPLAPLFLAHLPDNASQLLWFGCVAPNAAEGTRIFLAHPEVATEIRRLFDEVERVREATGTDLSLALESFLLPVPPEVLGEMFGR
ncbi:hypothetical protein ACFRFH_00455 [Leifsonia sp. NPDC056824]|uniref:hypothetical protein n=1 Tax=Leifsonia sp. NPDC056824 TaxID=3345953 RepID=UPI0036912CC4